MTQTPQRLAGVVEVKKDGKWAAACMYAFEYDTVLFDMLGDFKTPGTTELRIMKRGTPMDIASTTMEQFTKPDDPADQFTYSYVNVSELRALREALKDHTYPAVFYLTEPELEVLMNMLEADEMQWDKIPNRISDDDPDEIGIRERVVLLAGHHTRAYALLGRIVDQLDDIPGYEDIPFSGTDVRLVLRFSK